MMIRSILLVALLLLPMPTAPGDQAPMYDLVITGGRLVDGTGAPARRADLAVKDGKVAAIGMLPPSAGKNRSMRPA